MIKLVINNIIINKKKERVNEGDKKNFPLPHGDVEGKIKSQFARMCFCFFTPCFFFVFVFELS